MIGTKTDRTIALASLNDRRVVRPLTGPKGRSVDSMAATPDGKTIYYAAPGSIWSIPVADGEPHKLRHGLIDPDTGRVQIVRVGYDADIGGGWTSDGKILLNAVPLRSTLWRFRPAMSR